MSRPLIHTKSLVRLSLDCVFFLSAAALAYASFFWLLFFLVWLKDAWERLSW